MKKTGYIALLILFVISCWCIGNRTVSAQENESNPAVPPAQTEDTRITWNRVLSAPSPASPRLASAAPVEEDFSRNHSGPRIAAMRASGEASTRWSYRPLWASVVSLLAAVLLVFASYVLRSQAKAATAEVRQKNQRLELEIHDRRQMEEALRISESHYRGVFETTGTATLILGEDSIITTVNTEFERLSGYAREDVEGRMAWTSFIHPEDIPMLQKYQKARQSGAEAPSDYEFRFVDRYGHEKHVLNRVGLIPGTRQTVASLTDITSRKRTEEALKNSQEKYRSILQSIVEGYYEVDLDGNFTFVNDAICRIFQVPKASLLNMNLKDFTDSENAYRGIEAFRKVYKTGKVLEAFEWCIHRKDGTQRFLEASVALVSEESGEPRGFRGILHDVTDRKLAEEERNQLAIQLRQAQKMEALGTLAGGIAHNFNNILMGIQGYTSLMLLEAGENESRRKMLESIHKQVQSGSRLTTQLLGYAREGSVTLQPFTLNHLVRETSATFGATRKDIRIRLDLDQGPFPILGDHSQIEQILMNLLINAADALPRGGDVVLRTRKATPGMMAGKPYAPKPGPYVALFVEDNGIGMDEETQARIFEPFFTTKGLVNGTGLGLASVYGIVKAHGGYIDVASKVNEGTTFTVFLPEAETAAGTPATPDARVEGGGETVLLVDDEEIILDVGGQMLRQLGYRVLEAKSGQEAMEIASANRDTVDLVVFDMIMPEMSGEEFFEHLRSTATGVRTLLSSGYSLNSQARDILEKGCDGFIQKPFDLKELSRKVRTLLDKDSTQRHPAGLAD